MRAIGAWIGLCLGLAIASCAALAVIGAAGWPEGWRSGLATACGFAAVLVPCGIAIGAYFDRLRAWADRDPLTGAFNRRFLHGCFPRLARKADNKRRKIAVVLVDVDDFKTINDSDSHAAGDAVLRKLAEAMRESTVKGEIVGRLGGDEFVIVCPYGDVAMLDKLVESVRERIRSSASGRGKPITISAGAAVYPDDGTTFDRLTDAADRRMYRNKSAEQRKQA